ncbi:hypothetical protein ACSSS7_000871 [Eimeria intestinalis]
MASGNTYLLGSESTSSSFDYEVGEALLKASAAEAALLAKKAEGLSQILGLGPLLSGFTESWASCGLTDDTGEASPLQPAGKACHSEDGCAVATPDHGNKLSPTFSRCKSTGHKLGSTPQLLSEAFRSLDNITQPKEEEQQVAPVVETSKRRREEAGADESAAEEEHGDPSYMQAEDLFFCTPYSVDAEHLCLPDRDCQPQELKLARTTVLICLADMRDSCIPAVFVHPTDRKLRRKRVELHMIHVRDCDVMQQLLPYMHLFELPLVNDMLPHKMHAAAQRLLFSSLDMHARASESLYFPSYFEVS